MNRRKTCGIIAYLLLVSIVVQSLVPHRVLLTRSLSSRLHGTRLQEQVTLEEKEGHNEKELDVDENEITRRTFVTLTAAAAGLATFSVKPSPSQASLTLESSPASELLSDAATADLAPAPIDWSKILSKASKRAIGGGRAGASAAIVQVFSLMWLRTSMNYQYRYGGDLQSSLGTLWKEGGVARLYQGLPFALVQGPLTRFGDTAANVGILALLETLPQTQDLPLPVKTACGSIAAGLWRIILMPIDTSKTSMQVEGAAGLERLWERVSKDGPSPLYRGALAQAAATAVGHFPWFLTYNYLNEQLPSVAAADDLLLSLIRSAVLGLSASCVSDSFSNSLRVIKTTRQTVGLQSEGEKKSDLGEKEELNYIQIVRMIVEQDGVGGLLGRGLKTRLLTNMIQGAAFSVLWKYFQETSGVS